MKVKTMKGVLQEINRAEKRISAERDKLVELMGYLEDLADDCEEAMRDLENAADSLSRQV